MSLESEGRSADPIQGSAPVNTTISPRAAQHLQAQLEFYRKGRAGCAFAALAARNPLKYGWRFASVSVDSAKIDQAIELAVLSKSTTTMSLVFPEVKTEVEFRGFIEALFACKNIHLEQDVVFDGSRCLGFRVPVGDVTSWVSGFANFAFMPISRRAPSVELAFRVKPRPNYKEVLKESPKGTIHLADMDMLGLSSAVFKWLWQKSHAKTKALLGHAPDLRSAAKTTFSVPADFLQ